MTVTNARQYRITRTQLCRFEEVLASMDPDQGEDPDMARFLYEQVREQVRELREQLEEYECLAGSRTLTMEVRSLIDFPSALIHARIASGLTQSELAQRLGVTQQQVQRDEQTDYAHASLERLHRVWQVLGVRLDGRVTLSSMPQDEVERAGEENGVGAQPEALETVSRESQAVPG